MARKIHRAIVDDTTTYAVVETEGSRGGRQYGHFVNLSTVKVPNEIVDTLDTGKILGNSKVEAIETWEVDSRSTGSRSNYGTTLDAMLDQLPGHVAGNALYDSGTVQNPDANFEKTLEDVSTLIKREKLAAIAEKTMKAANGISSIVENGQLNEGATSTHSNQDDFVYDNYGDDEPDPSWDRYSNSRDEKLAVKSAIAAGDAETILNTVGPNFLLTDKPEGDDYSVNRLSGYTVLHAAAESGNVELCRSLVDAGANWQATCYDYDKASDARVSGSSEPERLRPEDMAEGACKAYLHEVERDYAERIEPIHNAVYYSNYDEVASIIAQGGDPNVSDPLSSNRTPLHHVKDEKIATLLIEAGADVHAQNNYGNTPLETNSNSEPIRVINAYASKEALTKIAQMPRSQDKELAAIAEMSGTSDFNVQHAAEQAITRADQDGYTELQDGAYLHSRENIQAEQADWYDTDSSKHIDFSTSPYWLTTNAEPIGISGAQDADLLSIVAVDERVVKLTQERSIPAALPPRPEEDLATADQVQAKRQAYGRAM